MNFDQGDRVMTPAGLGTVKYRIMAPPEYTQVSTYSVVLDHAKHQFNYLASLYPASSVTKEET